jgi:hypothetical protein
MRQAIKENLLLGLLPWRPSSAPFLDPMTEAREVKRGQDDKWEKNIHI